ncbi:unnamed protein product [Arctogadus glacialis]
MKWIIAVAVAAAAVLQVASCLVVITISASDMAGRYTYSSESVRNLWGAMDAAGSSHTAEAGIPAVCSHRALPEKFRPMCRDPNAWKLFAELEAEWPSRIFITAAAHSNLGRGHPLVAAVSGTEICDTGYFEDNAA